MEAKVNRRKTKLSPRTVRRIVIISVLVLALAAALVIYLRQRVAEEYGSKGKDEVLSAEVTTGTISTSVYGSGTLSDEDVEDVEIPDGVELTKIYVSRGDTVAEGDILATVEVNSVLSAMSALTEELEELDEDIGEAADETVASSITSSVSGRVKKIYAAAGDNVATVMYDNNALMLVSLDGYMAADIPCGTLAPEDTVTVTDSAGKKYTGTVSALTGENATVLISDNGTSFGDTVTAADAEGNDLGSGTLYIHDELKIVGFAGTVSRVNANENSAVYSGTTLLTLTDTSYTANYETLLRERSELEEELHELIRLYKEGAVYAPVSGTVKEVNAIEGEVDSDSSSSSSTTSASSSMSFGFGMGSSQTTTTTTSSSDEDGQSFSISPDKTVALSLSVDESDILSVSVGQSASVSVDSIDGETFEGTVTEIDKSGTSSGGVTAYTATVSLEKTGLMLSGMSASATITIDSVENALMIPVDALHKTSTSYYVYTSYDEVEGSFGGMVEVSIGIQNSNYVEIKSGLSEGDTVYYTESEDSSFSFPGMGGSFPGGGNMPSGGFPGGGSMPSGGGFPSGGGMSSGGQSGRRG